MDLEPMSIEETHSDVNPGVPSLQTDPLIYDDTIDTSAIQNVLFIDSSVKHFQEYANATTFPIVYSRRNTREELLQLLSTKFQHISRIAIVCHFREEPYFLNTELLFSDTNGQFMIDLVKQFNVSHLDYLACSTLQNQGWKDYYAKLHDATGITVGASDDNTGNLKYGGDWILESTQEDIQTVYFNDLIQNYASLLAVFTVNGINYTTVGSVATVSSYTTVSGIITIPSTITDSSGVIYNVTSIGQNAFSNCQDVTSVTIPSSVTLIDDYAFINNFYLTSVTIPNSVTTIGLYAFYNCLHLTSMTIPSSVTSIGFRAFESCRALTNFVVNNSNTNYSSDSSGVLFNKLQTTLISYIGDVRTSYTIPSSVTTIGANAFSGSITLSSISIPSSVTSIDTNAFVNVDGISSISVNVSNTNYSSDSYGVLFNKLQTTLIKYPAGNVRTSYTIPSSVTSIANLSFYKSTFINTIIIPSSVTGIDTQTFTYCTQLTSVFFLHTSFSNITINTNNFYKDPSTTKVNTGYYRSTITNTTKISQFFTAIAIMSAPIPTNLSGVGLPGRVNLSWTAATAPGYSVVTGYKVTYWVTSTPGTTTTTSLITGTSTTITGLLNVTSYTFQVVAYNNVDNSAPSSPNFIISTASAAAPVLISVSPLFNVGTVLEDAINVPISWATNMLDASYSSTDGTVNSFIVTAVTSANGSLKIGTSLGSATNWDAGNNTIDATRTGYWTPTANLSGTSVQAFKIAVKSDLGLQSTTELFVNINVTPVNDPPTVANAIPNQSANTGVAFDFSFNVNTFADIDIGNVFTYSVTSKPSWLTFTSGTRRFTGTPQLSDIGTSQVTVVATDDSNATVSTNFNMTVNRLNNAPTVANAITSVPSATQGTTYSYTFPANTFTDVDIATSGDSLSYTAFKGDGTSLSSTWLSTFTASTRTFSGTPQNADIGILNVKLRATDTSNASVDTSFNITVINTNDSPTIVATQSASVTNPFLFVTGKIDASDVDVGTTLTYSIFSQTSTYGTVTLTDTIGNWKYDLSSNSINYKKLANGITGFETIVFNVSDSIAPPVSQTLTVTVTGINDPPTIVAIKSASVTNPSLFVTGKIDASDVDLNTTLTYSIFSQTSTYGTVTLTDTIGNWKYDLSSNSINYKQLANGITGNETIIFNVSDTIAPPVSQTLTVTVTGINDSPTMSDMTKTLPKYDTSCNGVTDAADIDVGNTFTTTISGNSVGKYGSLTITSSTSTAWRYDLSSNSYNYRMLPVDATDTDIFNITVTDSSGAPVTKSLTITVTGISNPQVSTQLTGKIVDGYIKYGTINVRDLSNNLIAGPTQTDSLGNYSIIIPVSIPPISYIIECTGGTDIATNLPLTFPLKSIYTPVVNQSDFSVINSSNVFLTPLTTIVANIVTSTVTGSSSASAITSAITAATNKVAVALDISSNVVNTDYIGINSPTITNIKVAAAAVKIASITNIISTTETKVAATVLSNISTIIQQSSAKITIDNAFVQTAGGQAPITNLTSLVTTIVSRIDAATTLDSIYTKSIAGNTVASTANATFIGYTAPQLTAAIDGATPASSPGVISNICFKAGTKIVTDQGIVNIERITEQNSIRGKKVLLVSQTTNIDDYMVKIEKGALYENVPNADTWLTGEHKVFFNKEMIKSKSLVNGQTIVRENKISEVVYNILLEGENSGKMIANGMISETLSPKSVMVQLLVKLNKLSDKDRERDIIRINKLMNEEKERMKSGASRRP